MLVMTKSLQNILGWQLYKSFGILQGHIRSELFADGH